MKLPNSVLRYAQRKADHIMKTRKPDFYIGGREDPYMIRWWVIPRNKWFNIYLHNILKSDRDEALHDHPWINVSLLVHGKYIELTAGEEGPCGQLASAPLGEGELRLRGPSSAHRLVRPDDVDKVVTFFFTGPVWRHWGFLCPRGWRHWKDFIGYRDAHSNIVGRGCGEMDGPALAGGRIPIFHPLMSSSDARPDAVSKSGD